MMNNSEKLFASRMGFFTLMALCTIFLYVIYTEYSEEIKDGIFTVVAETFPNLDNEIAQL